MESQARTDSLSAVPEFLAGGGEMGQRIREFDWSKTPLGPVDTWHQSLRTCIRIMLTSRQPIWIGWGKDLIKFYNDPYKAIVGGKHPWALGQPASVVWKDIWREIEPMLRQVMEKNEGTYVESQLLIMVRNGYPEETYYTFSYTPIPGDHGGTEGMICANTDDTDRIISERQLKTFTQLSKKLTDSQSNAEVIARTIATLEDNPYDFPFALFYSIVAGKAVLSHSTDVGEAIDIIPREIDMSSDGELLLELAASTKKLQVVKNLKEKMGTMPRGAWEIAPENAIVLPIVQAGAKEPYGFLIVGLNPYRLLDEKYSSFFSLVADQIATSFANVHILEEERKRVEALAVLDRAKTAFFSNISHEFRTPLTLLLGPIEDVLNDPNTIAANKARMGVAYRNALRMQKLVNTLLEFSRIEAGRMEGRFSRVDIGDFTENLASSFRSAIEKAGMQLHISHSEIDGEVYVDIDMWEKIILNLVSNAFKYSREGSIGVDVRQAGGEVRIAVSDTGVGIPEDQLDKIFNRFHRVENIEGRSREGTGIGLAMVKELVRLHHGSIEVESQQGKGSVFTVSIPIGREHLPEDKIGDASFETAGSQYADAFVLEAMKWIPADESVQKEISDDISAKGAAGYTAHTKHTVVLADDNADMRDYVKQLLSDRFTVIPAVNGEDAFAKILKHKPDLLLSDVMMPKLDGFGLLKKVRGHSETRNIPVIFLSARAGEEAKVEGLAAGTDDYLVKPFSAKELLARVEANIKIAKSRIAAEQNLRNAIMQSPVAMVLLRGPSLITEIVNAKALEIWGRTHDEVINMPIAAALPEIVEQRFDKTLEQVYATGVAFHGNEVPIELVRFGKPELVYVNFMYEPLRDENNEIVGIIAVGIDVSEQVIARTKIEASQQELNEMANAVPQLVWVATPNGEVIYFNNRLSEFAGGRKLQNGNWSWQGLVHPDDVAETQRLWQKAVEHATVFQLEHRMQMKDGSYRWHLSRALPQKDESGNSIKWFGTATDIHVAKEQADILEQEVKKRTYELRNLNISLRRSNEDLQQFAHVASHDLREPVRKVKIFSNRLQDEFGELLPEKGKVFLEKVQSATERMFSMIEGVLQYSTLNSVEQSVERIDLNEILRNIEADLEISIHQRNAVIHKDHLPEIEGSRVLLYQLFYNLVNNALKFSKDGEPSVIRISSSIVQQDGQDFARVVISDNGIGFEGGDTNKIFDTFTRLNSKDKYEGTGLGLSLCRKIAERHHGSISATGVPGEGADFIVLLPLNQPEQVAV